MKATMESTDRIVGVDVMTATDPPQKARISARVWEGKTQAGVAFVAYIPLVQVDREADNVEFARALKEHKQPDAATERAIDLRFFID